jgi:histidinol phosphatase-like enzyme (inositol monophosphatase family)
MQRPPMDALIRAAEAAADVAGAAIRPLFRSRLAADLKQDQSPVTLADRTAEQVMRAVLAQRFPGHGILGEEFGLDNPDSRLRWVLDPIDGTRSFIIGRPLFGTLIGLLDGDEPILGLIDQCVTGERWIGAVGRPTHFRSPIGGAAGCRPCPTLAEAELSCTSPQMFGPDLPAWERLSAAARRTSFGGDCYAYGLIALGQLDIIAEGDLHLWDWTALVPVIEGAGGRMVDWTGQQLRPGCDGHVLAVGDAALLPEAMRLLAGRR